MTVASTIDFECRRHGWTRRVLAVLALILIGSPPTSAQSRSSSSRVVAKHSGMCMEVSGKGFEDGAIVWQSRCAGSGTQSFRFRRVAKDPRYYEILVEQSRECLQIGSRGYLQQYRCNGSDAQRFELKRDRYGDYEIVGKESARCLTVEDRSRSDRAHVVAGSCGAQKWRLSSDPER